MNFNDELIQKRSQANKQLLDILSAYLTEHKDIRFFQALYNLNII